MTQDDFDEFREYMSTDAALITIHDREELENCTQIPNSPFSFKTYKKQELLDRVKFPLIPALKFKAAKYLPDIVPRLPSE
jgi:hypothetical protein